MVLDPRSLIGCTLDECTFGQAWIRLGFACTAGSRISLDTQHFLQCGNEPSTAESAGCEMRDTLVGIYDLLDLSVVSVDVSYERARLVLSSGGTISLLRDGTLQDNLFLLTNSQSGEWAAFE
jgi:hypothetical protein